MKVGVDDIRDGLCPSYGVLCPCWTTAQLDTWFQPANFEPVGGIACSLD